MPLTPAQTHALLEHLNRTPNKRLGQNFLIDGNIVNKSLQLAQVTSEDRVIEIGPGLGTLTRGLLEKGAHVYAIELDPILYRYLSEVIVPEYPNFRLMQGDAVDHPLGSLENLSKQFKVVANLPYAIATPWLEKVLAGPLPDKMVLMLQKEAADRFTAAHGSKNFGAISIFLAAAYEQLTGHSVSSQCFYPVPQVGSVLLHLHKKPQPFLFSTATRKLIRQLFTQRRKQIAGLVKKMAEPEQAARWLRLLEHHQLTQARPEAIPQALWQALAEV